MNIDPFEIYHIYNQGNNKETIFFEDSDYLKFMRLFRKLVFPLCKVLAYCLMPNHFHFLIYTSENAANSKRIGSVESCELSNAFRLLQSSYAQYVNKKYNRTGSLFRQKAKAKPMLEGNEHYQLAAFQYIHQNPLKGTLVNRMEDWPYSSFKDFAGFRNGTLCDKLLAETLIGYNKNNFLTESYQGLTEELVQKLFYESKQPV